MKSSRSLIDTLPWLFPLLFLSGLSSAQVRIQNPHHLQVSDPSVQMVHQIVCRVVADEFHLKLRELDGTVTLVLGTTDKAEGKVDPTFPDSSVIYLDHWDEAAFAVTDMHLLVHKLMSPDRQSKLIHEIVRRLGQVAPVDAHAYHGNLARVPQPTPAGTNGCLSAINDSSVPGCTPREMVVPGRLTP